MKDRDIMYVYNDTNFESSLWQVIDNLIIIEEMNKEDIIGYTLDIAEKEPVLYKGFDLTSFMDMVDNNFLEDRYDENGDVSKTLENVFKKHVDFKALEEDLEKVCLYYPKGEEYIITEEDYNDYFL